MRLELDPPPHALTTGVSRFHLFNYEKLLAPTAPVNIQVPMAPSAISPAKKSRRNFDVGDYDFEDPFIDDGGGRNGDISEHSSQLSGFPRASDYYIEEIRRAVPKKRPVAEEPKPPKTNGAVIKEETQDSKQKPKHKASKKKTPEQAPYKPKKGSKSAKLSVGLAKDTSSKRTKPKNMKTHEHKNGSVSISIDIAPMGRTEATDSKTGPPPVASKTVAQMLQDSAPGLLGAFEQRWGSRKSISGPDAHMVLNEIRENMLLLFDDDADEDQTQKEIPSESTKRIIDESTSELVYEAIGEKTFEMSPTDILTLESGNASESMDVSCKEISSLEKNRDSSVTITRGADRGGKYSAVSVALTKIPIEELGALIDDISAEQENRLNAIRATLKACDEKKKPLVSLQRLIYEFVEAFVIRELLLATKISNTELLMKSRLTLRRSAYAALLLALSPSSQTLSTSTFAKAYAREKRKRVAANMTSMEPIGHTEILSQETGDLPCVVSIEPASKSLLSMPVCKPASVMPDPPRRRILADEPDGSSIRAAVFAHLSALHKMAERRGKVESKTIVPLAMELHHTIKEGDLILPAVDSVYPASELELPADIGIPIAEQYSPSDSPLSDVSHIEHIEHPKPVSPMVHASVLKGLETPASHVAVLNSPISSRLGEYRMCDAAIGEAKKNIEILETNGQGYGDPHLASQMHAGLRVLDEHETHTIFIGDNDAEECLNTAYTHHATSDAIAAKQNGQTPSSEQ